MTAELKRAAELAAELDKVLAMRYREVRTWDSTEIYKLFPIFSAWKKAEQGQGLKQPGLLAVKIHWYLIRYLGEDKANQSQLPGMIAGLVEKGEYDILTAAWEWLWSAEREWEAYL